ncbi:unnamed protein product [Bathycoccus prasinos]
MVFATKLQINAVFKKAAPAKKTVTPAKKAPIKKSPPAKKPATKKPTTQKKFTPPSGERDLWYPNAEAPAWLDGSMPGDRGFDPFGLSKPTEYLQFDLDRLDGSAAKNPSGNVIGKLKKTDNKPTERTIVPFNEAFDINRFRECELLHSRWAMLGLVGVIFGEAGTGVAWQDAGKVELEQTQYLGFNLWGEGSNLAALTAIEVLLVGTLEFYRSAELDQEKRCYPGGAFDPLGFASKSPEETFRLKTAELKHGRLAMVAMFGVAQQALNNGEGALEALTSIDDDVPTSKIYSLLSLSIFALLAGDVGMNFLAFLFAWVTKQGDLTFFTTNANGFWTEKLCILGFVILLLMDFKAVATRQIRRANAVLKTIKYAKETTVESIEQTRNVETFLTNVYMKSTFEILGALIALVGCLRTASPSLVPGSGALFSLPASIGPAIALFFGHAMFMLINTNVISQSANMTTPFPLQIRKTIATFDAMLAMLAMSCATFQKGWPGLLASSLFLLFSIYFTYENEIKKKMKERKKKAEKKGRRDFGSSSGSR